MEASSGIFLFSWLMTLFLGGGVGLPIGVPPLPEDPVLAKVAPEDCLAYFASAGMATPQASSPNQTEQLFAEPEVQNLAAHLERLLEERLANSRSQDPTERTLAEEEPTLVKALLTRPLALYVAQVKIMTNSPPQVRAGAVLKLDDLPEKLITSLKRCEAALVKDKAQEVTIDGTTFHQMPLGPKGPEATWGIKGKYLYAAVGEGEMEALLKRAGGPVPKWLTTLHQQLPVERVSTVGMINIQKVISLSAPLGGREVARVLEATGLKEIDRLARVSGLDREEYVTRWRVGFQGEPKGLLQLVNQKPLTETDLAVLPRDSLFAVADSVDLEKAYETVLGVVEEIDPKAAETFRANLERAEVQGGLKLTEDILRPLGNRWYLYDSPGEGGLLTGLTLVVSLQDAQAAADTQAKILRLVEAAREQQPGQPRRLRIQKLAFAGHPLYILLVGGDFVLAPAWCVTDKYLVVTLYPEALKGFLKRGPAFQPLAQVPEVRAALAGDGETLALLYTDTPRLFDMRYPLLTVFAEFGANKLRQEGIDIPAGLLPSAQSIRPHLRPSVTTVRRTRAGVEVVSRQVLPGNLSLLTSPVAIAVLLPAIQRVRMAAMRTQSMNNLKQIALTMHNYHDNHNHFPPAYRAGPKGKPLLSWRVLLLPYLGEPGLYHEFHLDEPWDSEHNKKLIDRMPKVYRSPASQAPPGMTIYETVRGPSTVFPGAKGIPLTDIPDGSSNTIMVVEVSDRKAVIWTKPDDFELNEKNPLDGLGGLWPGGFLAALCDGSVRMIRNTIDPKVLLNLFNRNDGNVIPSDAFQG